MNSLFTAEALIQDLSVGKQIILTSLHAPRPPLCFFSGGRKITTIGRNFNVVDSVIISDDQRSNLTVSLNLLYSFKQWSLKGLGFMPKVSGGSQCFSNTYRHASVTLLK